MNREWALSMAQAAAGNSRCRRRQIGAVITDNAYEHVWGVGWIRSKQEPDCLQGGCPRGLLTETECPPYSPYTNCISEHAEMAALDDFCTSVCPVWWEAGEGDYGADGWVRKYMRHTVMTVTTLPCLDCQRQLLRVGIVVQWPSAGGVVWNELGGVVER